MFLIADSILQKKEKRNTIINIANTENYAVPFIIASIEKNLNKRAVTTNIDKGDNYKIDVSSIKPIINKLPILFNEDYLEKLLKQYYHSK